MRRKPLVSLLLLATLLSACSGPLNEPRYGPGKRAAAEYRDESNSLTLAPGWAWPSTLDYPDVVDGDGLKYEINLGRIDAAWYWHCSWARTYFAATDPEPKQAALIEVMKVKTSAFYKWGLDEVERPRREKILNDFAEGKPEKFQRIIELNCPAGTK